MLYTIGLISTPGIRDTSNNLAALLLLLDFAVYFFLDAWPFAKIDSLRFHPDTSVMARIRLVCLAIAGVLIPLFSPRPFRPTKAGVSGHGVRSTVLLT